MPGENQGRRDHIYDMRGKEQVPSNSQRENPFCVRGDEVVQKNRRTRT